MVSIRRRYYIITFIALILITAIVYIWMITSNKDRQQQKIYSGAKLVQLQVPDLCETRI